MKKIAIIGSGIAGMACAYFLRKNFEIKVFEKNDYIGGHTNTVDIQEGSQKVSFDTGFMVFNFKTYPYLTKLFNQLNVPIKKTEMSFSVQNPKKKLEFCGSGLNGLFAQRKNLLSPSHWKLLAQINRFNNIANELIEKGGPINESLLSFKEKYRFSDELLEDYLIPMSSAVWSTPPSEMLNFSMDALIPFFYNHGFLGLSTQHQWYTVENGSRSYRDLLIKEFKNHIFTNAEVTSVEEVEGQVNVSFNDRSNEEFDHVILASHGDQSLKMLKKPTPLQTRALSPFKYQANKATIHSDQSLMPKAKKAWSSWNYRYEKTNQGYLPSTIYYMNRLQGVSKNKDYFVSINGADGVDHNKKYFSLDYEHPLFNHETLNKQNDELKQINNDGPIYFAGSYFKYGFHEDALASSVALCNRILDVESVL